MELLTTTEELESFLTEARKADSVALDMEFERERTYRPILQLVQAATRERAVLIDPLEIEDLGPLWDLIADPAIRILFHAGRQDLEIFWCESGGKLPQNLVDTQIAAALLGMGEQIGYGDLVRRTLKVHLEKGERTTNWGRRPLTVAQMQYALDDVLYLHGVADALNAKLTERGRLDWLQEEMKFYGDRGTWERSPDELWLRISRHRSLSGKNLAVLRELAVWREETASRRNIPRNRVIADDVIIDLAQRAPGQIEDLGALRRLHPREIERSGAQLIEAIARGLNCPTEDRPQLPKIRDDDTDLNLAIDLLATFVKLRGREVEIAATYLGNKKDISVFAYAHKAGRDRSDLQLGRGWRYELVGQDLERILDGDLVFAIENGRAKLREVRD
jgi:ribonuclease D